MQDVLSRRLKWLLKKRELTQTELAKQLGLSQSAISRVMKKPGTARLDTVRKVADALGEDLDRGFPGSCHRFEDLPMLFEKVH